MSDRRTKRLRYFWIAAITTLALSSAAAYAVSVSRGLSFTVTPSAVNPPVPAGASAAGFTTVALHTDWTVQLPANWLGGCAVAGNGGAWDNNDDHGHTWYLNLWWMWNYNNCHVKQVIDPSLGGLVLDCDWVVDENNYNYGRGCAIETASGNYDPGPPSVGETHDFPNNAYYQIVMRQAPLEPSSFGAFVTWPSNAIPAVPKQQPGMEYDVVELDAGNLAGSDAAAHNWHSCSNCLPFLWCGTAGCFGGPGGLPVNFNANLYHTFGLRTTSDGAVSWICGYVDDVFVNCMQITNFDSYNGLQRYFVNIQNFCDSWNYGNPHPCGNTLDRNGTLQHMYVKTIDVWSCASWATTQCNRSVLTGPP